MISPLPPDTARLLGSSVTISTPHSLVKELVDNSLDAGATAVDVTVSPNTVDRIHVRDNGSGIASSDFDALARRSHTSKLRTLEDLAAHHDGSSTLGFRGDALASINCVAADGLVIITRTADDPVATRLSIRPSVGGLGSKSPVSAPQGTTVLVDNFFGDIPVRRQHSVKNYRKTLAAAADLLLAYAFARPHVRFTLKVPGDTARSWSYVPAVREPSVRDVALKTFGKALAADTIVVEGTRQACEQQRGHPQRIEMVGLLPRAECRSENIKSKGCFVSVDGRPITASRGTGKKIAAAFKARLNKARGDSKQVPNPFMCLSIVCSSSALYDPNVAPLKDEVLFVDEKSVLDAFEELCNKAYPDEEVCEEATDSCSPQKQTLDYFESKPLIPAIERHISKTDTDDFDIELPDNLDDIFSIEQASQQQHPTLTATENEQVSPSENKPAEDVLRSVQMRTRMSVNMARNQSNKTDEDSLVDTIAIRIAQKTPVKSPRPQKKDDIRNFFPSTTSPTRIPIATDDTATPELTPAQQRDRTDMSSIIDHSPLSVINDSILNQEASILSLVNTPENAQSRSFSTPRAPPGGRRGRPQRRQLEAIGSQEAPGRNPIEFGRLGLDYDLESVPETPRPRLLETPPQSDVRRPVGPQTPFTPVVPREDGQSARNNVVEDGRGRKRARLAPGTSASRERANDGNRRGRSSPFTPAEPRGRVSLRPRLRQTGGTPRESPAPSNSPLSISHNMGTSPYDTLTRPQAVTRTPRLIGSADGGCGDLLWTPQSQERPSSSIDVEEPAQGGQWSHALQTLLMRSRSPSPADEEAVTLESPGRHEGETRAELKRKTSPSALSETASSSARHKRRRSSVASAYTEQADEEDPRKYYIRHMANRDGRMKRMVSRKLPLETPLEGGTGTSGLAMRMKVSEEDVERGMRALEVVERRAGAGAEGSLRDGLLDGRLRGLVEGWVGARGGEVEWR